MLNVVRLFVAIALLSCAPGCQRGDLSNRSGDNVIKIGFLGALTGDLAAFGKPTLDGMKLAADEINSTGGVGGRRLVIVEADDRGSKEEGEAITRKFIGQDKVAAIVGDPTSGITKAAAPIAQRSRVVLLSAGATAPGVAGAGEYVFRNTLLDAVAIPACLEYLAKELQLAKVVLVTAQKNEYAVGLSQTFRETLGKMKGITIVGDEGIAEGTQDYRTQIDAIRTKMPDLILFSGYYREGALLMKEARRQGLRAPLFGGDALLTPRFIELGGSAVEGSLVAAGFSAEHAGPETTRFINGFRAKYNGEIPGIYAAQGYDAVLLLAEAMKRAKSSDPGAFRKVLAQTRDFRGASGTLTIGPDREPVKTPLYLHEVKNGKFTLKAQVPVAMAQPPAAQAAPR